MAIDIIFDGGKKVNAVIDGFTVKTDQALHSGVKIQPRPHSAFSLPPLEPVQVFILTVSAISVVLTLTGFTSPWIMSTIRHRK